MSATLTPTPRNRRWATKDEAAAHARCTPRTIDRRIDEGKLKRYRNGKTVLIDLDDLDGLFESAN